MFVSEFAGVCMNSATKMRGGASLVNDYNESRKEGGSCTLPSRSVDCMLPTRVCDFRIISRTAPR